MLLFLTQKHVEMFPSCAAGPSLRQSEKSAQRATLQTGPLAPGREPLGTQQPLHWFSIPGETGAILLGRLLVSLPFFLLLVRNGGKEQLGIVEDSEYRSRPGRRESAESTQWFAEQVWREQQERGCVHSWSWLLESFGAVCHQICSAYSFRLALLCPFSERQHSTVRSSSQWVWE